MASRARLDKISEQIAALEAQALALTQPVGLGIYRGRELELIRDALGMRMWAGQRAIVRALFDKRYVAVRSSRKGGKTESGAAIIEAFAQTGPCNVISTAAGGRQVETGLWSRVNRLHANARMKLAGEITNTSLKLGPDWYAIGFSTNDSTRFQGFHAGVTPPADIDETEGTEPERIVEAIEAAAHDVGRKSSTKRLLLLFDECFGIDQMIFDAAKGSMLGDNVYVLAMGNPTREANDPHESCAMHQPGSRFHRIKIAALDAPDPHDADESFVTPKWLASGEELSALYKPDDPLYRPMVLGQFASGDLSGAVITYQMLEGANDPSDWLDQRGAHIGFDSAWKGGDKNVAALWLNSTKVSEDAWHGQDTIATWHRLRMLRDHWAGQLGVEIPWSHVHIDAAPVAAGIIDTARREGAYLDAVDFGGAPTYAWRDLTGEAKFRNRRAELYWTLRELLRTRRACLPRKYAQSWADLASVTYRYTDGSEQLTMEPKEKIRERLGRSPDHGDADVLAFAKARVVAAFRAG